MAYQVYRHYDKAGKLLYIGCTSNCLARTIAHSGVAEWFKITASITVEHFNTKDAAFAAEKKYIIDEQPPFNRLYIDRSDLLNKQLVIENNVAFEWLGENYKWPPWGKIRIPALNKLVDVGLAECKNAKTYGREYKLSELGKKKRAELEESTAKAEQ